MNETPTPDPIPEIEDHELTIEHSQHEPQEPGDDQFLAPAVGEDQPLATENRDGEFDSPSAALTFEGPTDAGEPVDHEANAGSSTPDILAGTEFSAISSETSATQDESAESDLEASTEALSAQHESAESDLDASTEAFPAQHESAESDLEASTEALAAIDPWSILDPTNLLNPRFGPGSEYGAEEIGAVPSLLRIPEQIAEEPGDAALPSPAPFIPSTGRSSSADTEVLRFEFRLKRSDAPTPEEALAQADWMSVPSRSARIGRRPELNRNVVGRFPTKVGDDTTTGEDPDISSDESTAIADILAEDILSDNLREAAGLFAHDDMVVPEVTTEGEPIEESDGRDERTGRTRRRKDRNRSRRRDRPAGTEAAADDSSTEIEDLGEVPASVREPAPVEQETAAPPPARHFDDELAAEAEALSRISLDQRLGKEILVNTGARETRIAYMVSGMLTELHIEREERLVGAVCKARVERVLPGIDAAFVDVSLERNAFLMAGDVVPEEDEDDTSHSRRPRHASISDLVKPRQEIMVQITKAPRSAKGARVSTRVSLPGRYLVLMPDSETVGVSRKIDEDAERDRLKKIARSIRPQGFGVIVRTEAENKTEEELRNDVAFLLRLWGQIQSKYKVARAPSIVHRDLSLTFKIIRDLFGSDVNRFVIDSRDEYEKVMELVEFISPRLKSRVILYEDPIPIFERLGIEAEIERLFRHKVWLKSGGWLAIDETEALTTIDVNSGKCVGSISPAQTHFKINMESVVEICRQLRLRDIGGMIILDLIDMANPRDRAAVMKALEANLKRDRSRTKIAHLSPLGLVEMTRKRTGETFSEVTTEPCPHCGGRGRTLNADTVSILAERELKKQALEVDDEAFLVMVNPAVAPYLIGPESSNADRLEREMRRAVYVRATDNLHIEKFEVVPADMQEVERQLLPYREGQVLDCVVEQSGAVNLPHAIARLDGYMLDLVNGGQYLGRRVRAKLVKIGRSIAMAEVVGGGRPVDKLGGP